VVEAGREVVWLRGSRRRAGPGGIFLINPGELHDGAADGEGYRYRAFYPPVATLSAVMADLQGDPDGVAPAPLFEPVVASDPALAARLVAAHRTLECCEEILAGEEALTGALADLLTRHGRPASRMPRAGAEPGRVGRIVELMASEPERSFSLDALAAEAGLSKFHFIRVFSRATGQTPHAYLVNLRVNRARELLAVGTRPAEAAVAAGFADQSHLTRVFKRIVGVTPGLYARAVCPRA
jgi:AraC-like DNA-binding protein